MAGWIRDQMNQEFAPTFALAAALAVLAAAVFFVGFRRPAPLIAAPGDADELAAPLLQSEDALAPALERAK